MQRRTWLVVSALGSTALGLAVLLGAPAASPRPASPTARAAPPPAAVPSEILDRLEAAFRTGWASATSELARSLAAELPGVLPEGSRIRGLECRVAFCRVEVSHASERAFEDFMTRAFDPRSSTLATGPVFAGPLRAPVPDAPLVTVIYVAEPGGSLPTGQGARGTRP